MDIPFVLDRFSDSDKYTESKYYITQEAQLFVTS